MSQRFDPEFYEWLTKEKLSRSIGARFFVRFHAALILAGSVAVGWLANRLMYEAGMMNMLVRHPLAILCSYGGFLVGLQLWIRYSGIREYLNARRSQELLEPKGPPATREPWIRIGKPSRDDWLDALLMPEGCFLVLATLVVMAILFAMGGYLIVYASDVMAEIVFELLLAAGLIRGIRRADMLVNVGIPSTTVWALLVCLALSIPPGLYALTMHPQGTTVGEVVRHLFR